jgi:hypothetical protein
MEFGRDYIDEDVEEKIGFDVMRGSKSWVQFDLL